MTVQAAIHIVMEEAIRYKRLADDLADDPLDMDGRCMEYARNYRKKAEAMETVIAKAKI